MVIFTQILFFLLKSIILGYWKCINFNAKVDFNGFF